MELKQEARTKGLELIHFKDIGIPHILSLARVELLHCAHPIKPHCHRDSFEICLHYDGQQYYEVDNVGYETYSGDVFISLPNEHHSSGNRIEEKSRFFYLIFECVPTTKNFIGLDDAATGYIIQKLYSVKTGTISGCLHLKPILDDIILMYNSDHPLKLPRINGLLVEFFYKLCERIDQRGNSKAIPQDIKATCNYIEEHILEDILVDDLARLVFLSTSHFKKKFKNYTSFAPHDYIMRAKIDLAKDMLRYTHNSVTNISFDLNFSSSQFFCKVFKKYTGRSPKEYRNAYLSKAITYD